jgi:hypothetical protein
MTDESKALPDWTPERGCVPDEWILAWCKGQLTEEQGDAMCAHCSECRECEVRLSDLSTPDWFRASETLRRAMSGGEPLTPWDPAAGCAPLELLVALHQGLLAEREEGLLSEHITGCPRCEWLLTSLRATQSGPTLLQRMARSARDVTEDDIRRMVKEAFRKTPREP